MSTATQERTEHRDPKDVYSERELEDQQQTLDELREERLPELAREREELREEIAEAVAAGEEPEEARERLRQVRLREEEFHAAASLLAERLRDRRRRRVRHEAEERLRSIRKKIGGLVGEAPRRAAKARELAEKLTRQLEWLAHAPLRRQLLQTEARSLASAFDQVVPELKAFDEDPREAAAEAKRGVSRVTSPREGLGLLTDPAEVVGVLRRLYDEESPTPGLLDRLAELEEDEESEESGAGNPHR